MALEDKIYALRDQAKAEGRESVPDNYQGVTKHRIQSVLNVIDRDTPECIDAIFALLDNEHDSWFGKTPAGTKFCDGASTAHIACHIGILQRNARKLDREGRDYWLKPLWEIGGIEKVYYETKSKTFILGHPVAKSSNSAYRLAPSFKDIELPLIC